MASDPKVHRLNLEGPPPAPGGSGGGGDDRRLERLEEKVSVIEQDIATIKERLNHIPTTVDMYKILGAFALGITALLGVAVSIIAIFVMP